MCVFPIFRARFLAENAIRRICENKLFWELFFSSWIECIQVPLYMHSFSCLPSANRICLRPHPELNEALEKVWIRFKLEFRKVFINPLTYIHLYWINEDWGGPYIVLFYCPFLLYRWSHRVMHLLVVEYKTSHWLKPDILRQGLIFFNFWQFW